MAEITGYLMPVIFRSNVCRSVGLPMTQALLASFASSLLLHSCFRFASALSAFVSFSVSRKVLIAYCFSCAVFKVRLLPFQEVVG